MEPSESLRHQMIKGLVAQHIENVAEVAIRPWEQMAAQIVLIVGEDGFNSLYARSVHLVQATFPWLAAKPQSPQPDRRFAELKTSLAGQAPAQAREANSLLLLTFTGILAALIGEPLTARILQSAWGNDASHGTSKEFKK